MSTDPWWHDVLSDTLADCIGFGFVLLAAPFLTWQRKVICPSCRRDRQWVWKARGAAQTHFYCPYCDD